jgi:hypothetical protein
MSLCLYYRKSHCTMKYPCPWGKSRIEDGRKVCTLNGMIGEGHKLGGRK